MSAWMVMPSAAPIGQARLCVSCWKSLGYKVAIACEDERIVGQDWMLPQPSYKGYANAVNALVTAVMDNDPHCAAVVAAGDDMFPTPDRMADQIAEDLGATHGSLYVVQGTGDRWTMAGADRPQSERVAGSPWMSREWCIRGYQGHGPLWPEYWHSFVDNDLAEVAAKLGLMHWDAAICHRHEHFLRHGRPPPEHSRHAYERFREDQAIFERRKAAEFPGSGLLP